MVWAFYRAGDGGKADAGLAFSARAFCVVWLVPQCCAESCALLAPQNLAGELNARRLGARLGDQAAGLVSLVEDVGLALVRVWRALGRQGNALAALAAAGAVVAGGAVRLGAGLTALAGLGTALVPLAVVCVLWARCSGSATAFAIEAVALNAGVDVADCSVLCFNPLEVLLLAGVHVASARGTPACIAFQAPAL
jgi:hypothetical protein